MEQGQYLLIVQTNSRRIYPGNILKHTDHGRIIVSENIQLQQVMVNGMIIKMRCYCPGRLVIGRMLYRRKGINLLSQRHDDDAARMLSRRPPDTDTAGSKTSQFTAPFLNLMVLKITSGITVGRLFRQRTDRSSSEGLTFTENNLCVIVGLALVFTGEV